MRDFGGSFLYRLGLFLFLSFALVFIQLQMVDDLRFYIEKR